jgi:hypothetical protein
LSRYRIGAGTPPPLFAARVDQPARIDRQQRQVQQQHRLDVCQPAIGDERQVARHAHQPQRDHAAHAEGRQHE